MSTEPNRPDVDAPETDRDDHDNQENEATGEGMPQSPSEVDDGTAE